MAYSKRRSTELEKAQARLRGLQSLQSDLNLSSGISLYEYEKLIKTVDGSLQTYNTSLSESDRNRIELQDVESQLSTLSSRILSAIAAFYGKDSKEYAMAGGKPSGGGKRKAATPSNGNGSIDLMSVSSNSKTNGKLNGASRNGSAIV
jgi:type II secretory pathway pseudopilin PulG